MPVEEAAEHLELPDRHRHRSGDNAFYFYQGTAPVKIRIFFYQHWCFRCSELVTSTVKKLANNCEGMFGRLETLSDLLLFFTSITIVFLVTYIYFCNTFSPPLHSWWWSAYLSTLYQRSLPGERVWRPGTLPTENHCHHCRQGECLCYRSMYYILTFCYNFKVSTSKFTLETILNHW